MTLTLLVRNPYTRQIGAAIASGSEDCAGGSLYMREGVGIVSVQAKGNRPTGEAALEMMAQGLPGAEILRQLKTRDTQLGLRQILLAPLDGDIWGFTGEQCLRWAGHIGRDQYVVAGNMLTAEKVLTEMEKAYLADRQQLLPRRLFAALKAGMAAGGDLRGHRSAAIIVMGAPSFSHVVTASPQVLHDMAAGVGM
jgi:uncharacterized Ntn-hydrolase superfamily protein